MRLPVRKKNNLFQHLPWFYVQHLIMTNGQTTYAREHFLLDIWNKMHICGKVAVIQEARELLFE